jgi:hypothetical protein
MEACIADIKKWTQHNSLMLNDEKTEFIIIGTRQQLAKVDVDVASSAGNSYGLPLATTERGGLMSVFVRSFPDSQREMPAEEANVDDIRVGNHNINKSKSVRNLGAWFNDTFDMSQHVSNLCGASFYQLHNIRRIRKYLTQETAESLVQ